MRIALEGDENRQRQKRKRRPTAPGQTGIARAWKTILYMLLMGVISAWVAALSYSFAIKLGLSPAVAARVPNYAFFVGLALGLGIALAPAIKDFFACLLVMVVLGSVFWFFGVVLEALFVAFGLSPEIASWISRIAFWSGVLIGSVTLYAFGYDVLQSLLRRLKGAHSHTRSDASHSSVQ